MNGMIDYRTRIAVATLVISAGWYLLAPPVHGNSVNVDAAVSRWTVIESFDSAADCEAMASRLRQNVGATEAHPEDRAKWRMFNNKCIATDDPRLKGK
jgi:hypothetical protein